VLPILQRAVNRAVVKAGTNPSSPPIPNPDYIALSAFPDFHFMGLAEDCGLVLGSSSLSSAAILSVVHSREVVQAKLLEAIDRIAIKEAAMAPKAIQPSAKVESTSVGTTPQEHPH
jgi:hypothetical protein